MGGAGGKQRRTGGKTGGMKERPSVKPQKEWSLREQVSQFLCGSSFYRVPQ